MFVRIDVFHQNKKGTDRKYKKKKRKQTLTTNIVFLGMAHGARTTMPAHKLEAP